MSHSFRRPWTALFRVSISPEYWLVLHQHMSNNYDSNTLITLIYPLISMAYINRVSFLWNKTARMDKKCFEHFIPLNKKKL